MKILINTPFTLNNIDDEQIATFTQNSVHFDILNTVNEPNGKSHSVRITVQKCTLDEENMAELLVIFKFMSNDIMYLYYFDGMTFEIIFKKPNEILSSS